MSIVAKSQKHYQIITLKKLIKKLFRKFKLDPDVHFDVWICGYDPNEEKDVIDKTHPWDCCHFYSFERITNDGTDVFPWLEFEVEDYEFEITEMPEYWLFVKLCKINADFSMRTRKL